MYKNPLMAKIELPKVIIIQLTTVNIIFFLATEGWNLGRGIS